MADGDYERRQGREAEIKRLQRIIREQAEKRRLADSPSSSVQLGSPQPGGIMVK